MADLTFLERAAELRQQRQKVDEIIDSIRVSDGEWIPLKQLSDEIMRNAGTVIGDSWGMLTYVQRIAEKELERATSSTSARKP